ncbi:MAG: ABC transporter permease, partial [Opitutales bacterium]
MTLLLGALTLGFILSLLALGVYISFRLFDVADITVDGSITLGAAVTAVMLVNGDNPLLATAAGTLAGMAAGAVTGLLQTKCGINPLVSGILVMTALYSVNLRVMGKSNISLFDPITQQSWGLNGWAKHLGDQWFGGSFQFFGWPVDARDALVCGAVGLLVLLVLAVLYWFFRTDFGTALRATGDNPQMTRALGVNVEACRIFGLALSNGLVGLCGALLCQYQDFADAQMGIGMIVWGLASVIIGEALTGTRSLGFALIGGIMGSVLFRLVTAIVLRMGTVKLGSFTFSIEPNDLKLITALCVFAALVLPR